MSHMRALVPAVLFATSCATAPLAVHSPDLVLGEIAARYHAFYPADGDPDLSDDVGLLRPRFGLPAIAQAGAPFSVELIERGAGCPVSAALVRPDVSDVDAEACVHGGTIEGCHPLSLSGGEPLGGNRTRTLQAQPASPPPPGGYDLYLHPSCDAPERAPRAVWLREDDPAQLREVRVAHLSDLHVGKHRGQLEEHLRQVIDEVNRLRPDLVLITGDIVNQGLDAALGPRARALLLELHAPLAVVIGNHDIGFRSFVGEHYGAGWENFARVFHPFLEFELSLGGYRFIGFDSGPSTFSPRILVRGLGKTTVQFLGDRIAEAERQGERGVVLFSHAPTRAVLSGDEVANGGAFGHMRDGAAAFERLLLQAAERGQRVLHLAGHTHWSDLFEARPDGAALKFVRWPDDTANGVLQAIRGKAALVTTQAASHAGITLKPSARGFGFTFLVLGDGAPRVAFYRHDPASAVSGRPGVTTAQRDSLP
jgi:hypothetical protein